jgi:hypothetical protein
LDIFGLLGYMCGKIAIAFMALMVTTMIAFEASMREPLQHLGLPVPIQTVMLILVPALSLIVASRMMRGIVRFAMSGVLLTFIVHASWPLVASLLA